MAAKKKTEAKMGVKEAAKKAQKAKEDIAYFLDTPHPSTRKLVRKNTRGGKLSFNDKVVGVYLTEGEGKAAKIMQARREGDRTRSASRAKGIAARQAKVAKARRAKKALGN